MYSLLLTFVASVYPHSFSSRTITAMFIIIMCTHSVFTNRALNMRYVLIRETDYFFSLLAHLRCYFQTFCKKSCHLLFVMWCIWIGWGLTLRSDVCNEQRAHVVVAFTNPHLCVCVCMWRERYAATNAKWHVRVCVRVSVCARIVWMRGVFVKVRTYLSLSRMYAVTMCSFSVYLSVFVNFIQFQHNRMRLKCDVCCTGKTQQNLINWMACVYI